MRSKTQSLPYNLLDIADTDTVDYNDDTNLEHPNMNKNAILVAKKISDKYRTIRRKRKMTLNRLRVKEKDQKHLLYRVNQRELLQKK